MQNRINNALACHRPFKFAWSFPCRASALTKTPLAAGIKKIGGDVTWNHVIVSVLSCTQFNRERRLVTKTNSLPVQFIKYCIERQMNFKWAAQIECRGCINTDRPYSRDGWWDTSSHHRKSTSIAEPIGCESQPHYVLSGRKTRRQIESTPVEKSSWGICEIVPIPGT